MNLDKNRLVLLFFSINMHKHIRDLQEVVLKIIGRHFLLQQVLLLRRMLFRISHEQQCLSSNFRDRHRSQYFLTRRKMIDLLK